MPAYGGSQDDPYERSWIRSGTIATTSLNEVPGSGSTVRSRARTWQEESLDPMKKCRKGVFHRKYAAPNERML
jgi:hypothetical protein